MAISPSEAHYIIESCLTDLRIDGRTKTEHRSYTITNRTSKSSTSAASNPAAPTLLLSNGSSRIHLPGSTTDVLCSVKADLVHPSPKKPNEGVLELNVDLSLCGGGGSIGSSNSGSGGSAQKRRRQQREEESQISSLLQRLVLPHAVNYDKLVVWPGKYVWRLSIDVVVIRCDGCVLDASSIALREALRGTKLPRVQAVMGIDGGDGTNGSKGSENYGNFSNMSGGVGRENDLMVDGDIANAVEPSGASDCPLVITVSVLSVPPSMTGGISSSAAKRSRHISIVDARTEEEACATSKVCVSVDLNGMVCGVHTLGGSEVSLGGEEEGNESGVEASGGSSMPLAMLGDIVTTAALASKNLYLLLDREGEDGKTIQRHTSVDDGSGYGNLLRSHFLIQ